MSWIFTIIKRLIPDRIRKKIWQDIVVPGLVARGWTLSMCIPIEDKYLTGTYFYDEELEIKEAISKLKQNTMLSFERLATLWQQVRYLDRYEIPGCFVECGVWKGGAVGMMALAHCRSHREPNRTIHLFDSFEGMPEPIADLDGQIAVRYSHNRGSGDLKPVGTAVGTLEANKQLLEQEIEYPEKLLRYHVGWFQHTVPCDAKQIQQIALLRLDGDWYESTMVCLTHLYPRVARGGVVVIDDYGHWEGCRRAVDEFIQSLAEPISLNHIDYTGRFWIKV